MRFVATGDRIATTTVDAGNGLTFDQSTFIITAAASNMTAIVITVSNNPFTLAPGQTVQLVRDETPPSLAVENLTVNATAPDGAIVSYSVSATDAFDPNPIVACAPASDGLFPIGSTTVSCTATDRAGNSSSATFVVTVLGAAEQIVKLIELLKSTALPPPLEARLIVTLQHVLSAPNNHVACVALRRFTEALESTPGSLIPAEMAAALMADGARIGAVMSCPSD
ncbi:MAG TPA: HYR domain-containing protein [Thermoanaerobaculia bacterium]|nr:HYR domain-containing protein [Thermoanaerobaculia bacterium]